MASGFFDDMKISSLENALSGSRYARSGDGGTSVYTVLGNGNELRIELSDFIVAGFKAPASEDGQGCYFGLYHLTDGDFAAFLEDVSDILGGRACAVNVKSSGRGEAMRLERIEKPSEKEAARIAEELSLGGDSVSVRFSFWDSGKNTVITLNGQP